jgi:hypothetical protein
MSNISLAGVGGLLLIYAGRSRRARIEELTEAAECLEGDHRLGDDHSGGTGGAIEHPSGDLEGACAVAVQPAVEDRDAAAHAVVEDVDIPTEPGMERIADSTDIDQSGLVLGSSSSRNVITRSPMVITSPKSTPAGGGMTVGESAGTLGQPGGWTRTA